MSLLRRNELCIELSPQQIDLTSRRNGWRGVNAQQLALPCVPTGPIPWTAPLAVVENFLKQQPWSSGNVTVILSNHFVRYMLIPWSEMLLRSDEQQTYLQHLFTDTYGEIAARYALRLSPAAPGMERIASAIDITLLDQLRATVADAGLRLDSIQPWLMHKFNKHRHQATREGGWFVTVEHGVMGVIGMANGAWRLVRTLRCTPHWQQELHTALERLYLSGDAGNIPKVLHWCSTDADQATPAFNSEWQLIQLETKHNSAEKSRDATLATAA